MKDLVTTQENSDIYNLVDCNKISTMFKCKDTLLATLENELEKTCDWFRVNNMILNPEKFQSMTL